MHIHINSSSWMGGGGSQLHFLANRNTELAIILASKLHKNRGTCCTAELPFYLFPILCLQYIDVVLITVLRKISRGVACYHYRLIYCFPNNYCFRRQPFGKFLPRTVRNTTISDIKRWDTWTERFCL